MAGLGTTGSAAAGRRVRPGFLGIAALLCAGSVAVTIRGSLATSGMGATPMPGGWLMSMLWFPGCGRGWLGTIVDFLAMWDGMMAAMMLPSLIPVLWRYSQAGAALAGLGYAVVWTGFGLAVFGLGAATAAVLVRRPALAGAVPLLVGLVVALAGALQFTSWKAHHLACCRRMLPHGSAWWDGLRLGLHCCACSLGPTGVLLAFGMMTLPSMSAVAIAVTVERLAADGIRAARWIGVVALGVGAWLVVRTALP